MELKDIHFQSCMVDIYAYKLAVFFFSIFVGTFLHIVACYRHLLVSRVLWSVLVSPNKKLTVVNIIIGLSVRECVTWLWRPANSSLRVQYLLFTISFLATLRFDLGVYLPVLFKNIKCWCSCVPAADRLVRGMLSVPCMARCPWARTTFKCVCAIYANVLQG